MAEFDDMISLILTPPAAGSTMQKASIMTKRRGMGSSQGTGTVGPPGLQASLKTTPDKSDRPLVRRTRPGVAFLTAVALAKEVAKTDGGRAIRN